MIFTLQRYGEKTLPKDELFSPEFLSVFIVSKNS